MECKNCQNSLSEDVQYCAQCGAKVIRNRLTFRNLFAQFFEQFLNYDNKFLQTFLTLFTKPESVVVGYINGIRKKYVNPISYFAIAITIGGLQMFLISKLFPEGLDMSTFAQKGQEEAMQNMMQNIMEYQSVLFMLNVPIFAIMSKIVFFTLRTYNYTEHLVIFLYLVSQSTLALFIPTLILIATGITYGELTWYVLLLQILYVAYCFKRIYNLSNLGIVLRSLFFLLVLIVFYVVAVILVILISVLTNPQWIQDIQQAQEAVSPPPDV